MFVIYGLYRWFPKTLGFRRDYCRACQSETVAVRVRTVKVFHVFWVPLLPVGWWSGWHCQACGKAPHAVAETRKGFKIAGAVLLALGAVSFWLAPLPPDEIEPAMLWGMRIGLPVATALVVWSIFRHVDPPAFKQRLAVVRPHDGPDCLLCGGVLQLGTPTRCGACGVGHQPLNRPDG